MQEIFARLSTQRALVIGLILAASYYFLFYDNGVAMEAAIQASKTQSQQLQQQVNKVQSKIDRAREFQEASQTLGSSLQKLLSFIPAHFRIGQMMQLISREARVSGLDIVSISEQNVSERNRLEDFTELGVRVEIAGQYNQFLTFMSNLTRQRQIFLFENIEMSAETSTNPEGVLKFSAEIHAYSYNGTMENGKNNGQNSVN